MWLSDVWVLPYQCSDIDEVRKVICIWSFFFLLIGYKCTTSKYLIYDKLHTDVGDDTLIVSQFSSSRYSQWVWGWPGCRPPSWRGSSSRDQGGQAGTGDSWSSSTPHHLCRPGDKPSGWELTPGSWLPDLSELWEVMMMCPQYYWWWQQTCASTMRCIS